MKKKTSIFLVNSYGFMCQWKGNVVSIDESTITIRFSKNKVLMYRLKDLGIDFVLVTKTLVKDLGVCVSNSMNAVSFDDSVKQVVLDNTQGNVEYYWNNGAWEIKNVLIQNLNKINKLDN